jgi:glycosyltransferase involved in cell wall biosynthesis
MIVPFFPPVSGGGVFRPLSHVKYLDRYNWRTTVIAPKEDAFWVRDETLLEEVPASCRIIRTNSLSGQAVLSRLRRSGLGDRKTQVRSTRGFQWLRRLGNTFLIPDTYIGWYPFAVRAAKRALGSEHFDAIYSTSPPETSHLIGLKLHRISALPWVADFRDPWINLYRFAPPSSPHRMLYEKLQSKICSRAGVVVASKWNLELLEKKHSPIRHIKYISNGYDGEKLEGIFSLSPPREPFTILHAGMLSENRSAVPFIRALKLFCDRRPQIRGKCRVIFLGPREDENEATVRELSLADVVHFRDSTSHRETLHMERSSHILMLINPYPEIVVGKLYEYIGVRRPILALLPDGEGKELVRSYRRGETAPMHDPERIAEKIGVMYEKYADETLEESYDLSPLPQFDRRHLAGEMAEFLDQLLRDEER